ncbi:MAG TPA: NAD(P)/FAD-dependent oxidoreductase [Pusillimonas sp.]|uniref:NAD(P)/FAD-dependent oxidoreductase n=1 Tax=Pusillimonas sp. TaxID=3040095 RepID=UPI002BCF978B|nr:NAD(P)/FAD-dependent oxidoreductase [Pusillimonas sp.]HUH87192.1 NAD(P)/FAD-dependent oxidoreductase [Pusillimonas sp.]
MNEVPHRVVIVGGGAGGLELAIKMGRRFGAEHVFLVDKASDHIWKPSLHEVAAGTLDIHREGLSYVMLAKDAGFTFIYGELRGVDRQARVVKLDAVLDDEGHEIFPTRDLAYDTLVLAVGSRSNFFGTPGAREHAVALDSTEQAERFRKLFLRKLVVANNQPDKASRPLEVAIVGGGATGVELAAELIEATKNIHYYGLDSADPSQLVRITLLEGAARILVALPPKMSAAAQTLLESRKVQVRTSVRVAAVREDGLSDSEGVDYPCDICVWAAGIEAPSFLRDLGLSVNRLNQLVVDRMLRTDDPDIFAFGDCAQVPWDKEGEFLPARAQVAHQQADFLIPILRARIQGTEVAPAEFRFKDYGSLVAVGHTRGVGSLMGVLSGKSWFVEGVIARLMYMSLHLMHHLAVLGLARTCALALGRLLLKRSTPRVKLH